MDRLIRRLGWGIGLGILMVACDDPTDARETGPPEIPRTRAACDEEGWTWVEDPTSNGPPGSDGSIPVGPTMVECVIPCASDADCDDTGLPFCSTKGLYRGGDYYCNGTMKVCREARQNQCP